MSITQLTPILMPQKIEPLLAQDLLSIFHRFLRDDKWQNMLEDGRRAVRAQVFKAFFGGHLRAVAELKNRWEYGLGDYSLVVIQRNRQKFILDFENIMRDYATGLAAAPAVENRLKTLAQVCVWTLYNEGKLSSYRQRSQGRVGLEPFTAQVSEFMPMPLSKYSVIWVAQMDELIKPCVICSERNGKKFPLYGPLPEIPAHPHCRCEWGYEELSRG